MNVTNKKLMVFPDTHSLSHTPSHHLQMITRSASKYGTTGFGGNHEMFQILTGDIHQRLVINDSCRLHSFYPYLREYLKQHCVVLS